MEEDERECVRERERACTLPVHGHDPGRLADDLAVDDSLAGWRRTRENVCVCESE